MRAYCFPDGVIHFTNGEVPDGAICFAAHDDDQTLLGAIAISAAIHANGRMFVVPGFFAGIDQRDGLRLLIAYSRALKNGMASLLGESHAA